VEAFSVLIDLNLVFFCYLRRIIEFLGFDEIIIIKYFVISIKSSLSLIYLQIFSRNDSKNRKIDNTFKAKNISWIAVSFFLFYLVNIFRIQNERKWLIFVINPDNTDDFFPPLCITKIIRVSATGCVNENISQGRSHDSDNINISYCSFLRTSSYTGNGGVIYIDGATYSMSINYSMFKNCVCSNYGGAIYSYSSNSYLGMICANRCFASWYHFAHLGSSQANQVEYLSVSNCSYTTSGNCAIFFQSGNQRVDNANSSMNNANIISGIGVNSPSPFTSSHCTFSNNKASSSRCIYFNSNSGKISMSNANIIHNNSPSDGVVFSNGAGLKMLTYCIFQNNQNYLFYLEAGSLELSHSFIYHSSSFSTSASVSTTNNSFTCCLIYQIQFFNSHYCNADIPLTPMNNAPRTYDEVLCTFQKSNREISVVFSFLYLT